MAFVDDQQLPEKIKDALGHGSIVGQSICEEYKNSRIIFSWRIFKYSELRHHVLYFQSFENTDFKCILKLLKTNMALFICLRSGQVTKKSGQFCIEGETGQIPLVANAKELIEGLYVGDFMHNLFLHRGYVNNDTLTVSFRYLDISEPTVRHAPLHESGSIAEFCNDMKHMHLASLHSDFTIRVRDYTFSVHKFVLAARSKFFEDFFAQRGEAQEYRLEADPRIVYALLVHLYSGELKTTEMASMVEMFVMAHELRIPNLSDKCVQFISENINEDNFSLLLALAKRLGSSDLKKVVNRFNKRIKKERKKGELRST